MIVNVPCSLEQELLIEEHLLNGKKLFIAPNERQQLVAWVQRNKPGYKVLGAELDLENTCWKLNLESVTVTT